jgi:hypothetical protein
MVATQIKPFQKKIYLVGDVVDPRITQSGQIADREISESAFNRTFVNSLKYDGESADAPVFIMAEEMKHVSEEIHKGLLATYDNQKPIAVIRGSEHLINQVLNILHIKEEYQSPDGFSSAEIFVIDKEKGANFRWALYTTGNSGPNSTEKSWETDESNNTAQLFRDWISSSGSRVTKKVAADKREAVEALAVVTASTAGDMESYVHGFNSVNTIPDGSNFYQLSYWIYSVHDFKDDVDWYYVRQEGQLNASGNYRTYEVKDWRGYGYTARDGYMYSYNMNNWFINMKEPDVQIFKTSPSTETTSTKVTSEMDWGFSGDLGFEGTKPTGNVGVSLDLKNTSEVIITDCQAINKSLSDGQNARWLYQFREVSLILYFGYVDFSSPSNLQIGLLQPINKWLWRVKGSVRTNPMAKQFRSEIEWGSVNSRGKNIHGYWCSSYEHKHSYGSFQFSVPLTFPPLLMVDLNLSLSKSGQSTAMDIAVGNDWKVSSDQSWCHVEPESSTAKNKRINITVDENLTGNDRNAKLTFIVKHGEELYSTATNIFQSQY